MMNPMQTTEPTLASYTYQSLQRSFKKIRKLEVAILADQDREAVHDMRVELRRLRTMVQGLAPVLKWPKAAQDKYLRRFALTLGQVRDLDVLQQTLIERYATNLSGSELEHLTPVIKTLTRARHRAFEDLKGMQKSKVYRKFRKAFKRWLKDPVYQLTADLKVNDVIPDLQLPGLSQLWLHPGWWVTYPSAASSQTSGDNGSSVLAPASDLTGSIQISVPEESIGVEHPNEVGAMLLQDPGWLSVTPLLHSLRKQIKRVRYRAELFVDYFDPGFKAQLHEFRTLQDILGSIQDAMVLDEFLTSTLGDDWATHLPTLQQQLQQDLTQAWQSWCLIQPRYQDPEFRQTLRQMMGSPLRERERN